METEEIVKESHTSSGKSSFLDDAHSQAYYLFASLPGGTEHCLKAHPPAVKQQASEQEETRFLIDIDGMVVDRGGSQGERMLPFEFDGQVRVCPENGFRSEEEREKFYEFLIKEKAYQGMSPAEQQASCKRTKEESLTDRMTLQILKAVAGSQRTQPGRVPLSLHEITPRENGFSMFFTRNRKLWIARYTGTKKLSEYSELPSNASEVLIERWRDGRPAPRHGYESQQEASDFHKFILLNVFQVNLDDFVEPDEYLQNNIAKAEKALGHALNHNKYSWGKLYPAGGARKSPLCDQIQKYLEDPTGDEESKKFMRTFGKETDRTFFLDHTRSPSNYLAWNEASKIKMMKLAEKRARSAQFNKNTTDGNNEQYIVLNDALTSLFYDVQTITMINQDGKQEAMSPIRHAVLGHGLEFEALNVLSMQGLPPKALRSMGALYSKGKPDAQAKQRELERIFSKEIVPVTGAISKLTEIEKKMVEFLRWSMCHLTVDDETTHFIDPSQKESGNLRFKSFIFGFPVTIRGKHMVHLAEAVFAGTKKAYEQKPTVENHGYYENIEDRVELKTIYPIQEKDAIRFFFSELLNFVANGGQIDNLLNEAVKEFFESLVKTDSTLENDTTNKRTWKLKHRCIRSMKIAIHSKSLYAKLMCRSGVQVLIDEFPHLEVNDVIEQSGCIELLRKSIRKTKKRVDHDYLLEEAERVLRYFPSHVWWNGLVAPKK